MQSFYHHASQMVSNADIQEVFENLAQAVEAKKKHETLNTEFMKDI